MPSCVAKDELAAAATVGTGVGCVRAVLALLVVVASRVERVLVYWTAAMIAAKEAKEMGEEYTR